MNRRPYTAREPISHSDDWLMTYADLITLLLCFFAIFLSVSMAKKTDMPRKVETVQTAIVPVPLLKVVTESDERETNHAARVNALPAGVADNIPDAAPAASQNRDEVASVDGIIPPAELQESSGQSTVRPPAAPPQNPVMPQAVGPVEKAPPGGDRITVVELSSAALFDSGSAALTASGEGTLQDTLDNLNSNRFKDYRITVEGHTDDTPIHTLQFPSNWELSTARAAAVVRFLLTQGIPADRVHAEGFADTSPKFPNRDADGEAIPDNQAQNRRVVIKLEKIDKGQSEGGA